MVLPSIVLCVVRVLKLNTNNHNKNLTELALLYLERLLNEHHRTYKIIPPPDEVKKRGLLTFIVYIKQTGERWGVLVKDWKRSLGSDLVMRFKRVIDSLHLSSGIIIGNRISELARERAKRYGYLSLTRGEIVSYLRNRKSI